MSVDPRQSAAATAARWPGMVGYEFASLSFTVDLTRWLLESNDTDGQRHGQGKLEEALLVSNPHQILNTVLHSCWAGVVPAMFLALLSVEKGVEHVRESE